MARGRRPALSPEEVESLLERYAAGENPHAMRFDFGVDRVTLVNYLKRAGVYEGDRRPGRHRHSEGYISVMVPRADPMRVMSVNGKVLEHRLVMARHLGRPLRSDEHVHHKNGVKDDNRLSNLQLVSAHHPVGVALCCGECGSNNIIHKEI